MVKYQSPVGKKINYQGATWTVIAEIRTVPPCYLLDNGEKVIIKDLIIKETTKSGDISNG